MSYIPFTHAEKVRVRATGKNPGGSYRRSERSPKYRDLKHRMGHIRRANGLHVRRKGKHPARKPKMKK